jgi:RNA recognition motif-containing protein
MNRCAIKNENGDTEMFNDGCKGYGFIMFAKAEEASAAISFLNQEGYPASMARASISSKLRGLQDNFSCNLYFANIPQSFDEKKLAEYLRAHLDEAHSDCAGVIESVRVLRSHDGQSKRVGFARFSNRKAAESIMSKLNGTIFEGSSEPAHVRFADNSAQKMLKAGARNISHAKSSNDTSSCASLSTCHFYDVVTSQSDFNESTSSVGAWL